MFRYHLDVQGSSLWQWYDILMFSTHISVVVVFLAMGPMMFSTHISVVVVFLAMGPSRLLGS